jgi:hypothetical protein
MNCAQDIYLEGLGQNFADGLLQAPEVRRFYVPIKRRLTFPVFVQIEASRRV